MTAIRKNILRDANARDAFIKGLKLLKNEIVDAPLSTYDFFVLWHHQAMMQYTPATQSRRNSAHVGPVFLPWHRFFLLVLEQELQRVLADPDFGLPYWAWNLDGDLPADKQPSSAIWSAECMGGQGEPVSDGPFAFNADDAQSWRVRVQPSISMATKTVDRGLRRAFAVPGESPAGLPTSSEVRQVLALAPYDEAPWLDNSQTTFRNALEGWGLTGPKLHNLVHVWVGGDMSPSTSPNDPVFFLNHCNVDRIWAAWQAGQPAAAYLPDDTASIEFGGHRISDTLWAPFDGAPAIAQMLDVSSAYAYDSFSDISDNH